MTVAALRLSRLPCRTCLRVSVEAKFVQLDIVGVAQAHDADAFAALAESCTGGLTSALLTEVPGASAYFLGTVVPYADGAKSAILGVAPETIRRHGAVSEEAAREMARGARDRFDADLAASITGIAGPDGGSEEKPVGTVFFAIAERNGRETAKRRLYGGDRATVRRASAMFSLEMIRRFVTAAP